jgi:nicotinate-nucleotide adenylyltransferase
MGQDQLAAFRSWREWQAILGMVTLCVARRAATGAPCSGEPDAPALPPDTRIRFLDLPDMPVSATEIRARASRGEGIASMVPPGVASYIASHHLYRPH